MSTSNSSVSCPSMSVSSGSLHSLSSSSCPFSKIKKSMDQERVKLLEMNLDVDLEPINKIDQLYRGQMTTSQEQVLVQFLNTAQVIDIHGIVKQMKKMEKFMHNCAVKVKEYVLKGPEFASETYVGFVMLNVEQTLEEHLIWHLDRGGYTLLEAVFMALRIIMGVNYWHEWGYYHLDLHPRSVFYSTKPQTPYQVSFFGSAGTVRKVVQCESLKVYRAPETFAQRGGESVDHYALGVLLLQIFIGKKPSSDELKRSSLPDDLTDGIKDMISQCWDDTSPLLLSKLRKDLEEFSNELKKGESRRITRP